MKKEILFAAALSVAVLSACDKAVEIRETARLGEGDVAELTVNIPLDTGTKAAGSGTEADENTLASVQVFVFNDSGSIETYETASSGSLKLSCTMGDKTIAAIVNAPSASDVKSLTELRGIKTLLSDNGRQAFVMYGEKAVSVNSASVSVSLDVYRFAAKVVIGKINNGIVLTQYQSTPIEVTGIYLINVAGDATMTGGAVPTLWENKRANESSSDCLYCEKPSALSIAHGKADESEHHFYCYPNPTDTDSSDDVWTPRHTRLVVETSIGGGVYYYPITLPKISANTIYTVNELTITRLGVETPDVESVIGGISFTINVAPWKNETVQSVTI